MPAQSPKLGEILVRAGVIDQLQLDTALGEQAQWGHRLGVTLVKLGFLEERDLVRALAHQLGLPVAGLEGKRIHPDVLRLVPYELAEKAMMLPLFIREEGGKNVIYAGMADPCDLAALDDVRFHTGMQIKPVLIAPSELAEGIDRFYRDITTGPGAFRHTEPSPATPFGVENGEDTASMHVDLGAADGDADDEPLELEHSRTHLDRAGADPAAASAVSNGHAFIALPGVEPGVVPRAREGSQAGHAAPAQAATTDRDALSRLVVRALAQLLVEKGVLERDELQARIRALEKSEAASHG